VSPALARARLLEDALRTLAEVHGLERLLADRVTTETREVVRDAVRRSARRADALARAATDADPS
jgi:hypothetical protein